MHASRAVLYDHDGTLVDSLAVVVAATNVVLRGRHLPERSATEIIKAMVLATAPRMGFHAGIDDPDLQLEMAGEFYAAAIHMPEQVRVYAGVPALLATLAERGLQQGVISNNQGAFIRAAMRYLRLDSHFATLLGEEDVPATKPSPSGLLLAAKQLGADPAQCVFIGDGPPDAQAAAAAGMCSIGVTWGIHTRAEMADMGFNWLVDHPHEVLDLVQ